ncbi:type III secretion system stator protein SctL [Massilia sp. Root335]|uniref:type III secretion system stator protein SctL n=1 Tax=Massilia sp. Root335 TaxID=1736517 RepID=UPI00138F21A7|nr:type III secretion system stator protein SctL [Massilia sp. Root335]
MRSPRGGIGVGQDVLRAGDMAGLVALDGAAEQCRRQVEELIAAAEEEAEALRQAARAEAVRMMEAARAEYDTAEQRGYEAGRARALEAAQETMLRGAEDGHDALLALRDRIADVVLRTVARALGDADSEALFARIGADLSRHLDDASYLSVRVAPEDVAAATRAFGAVCAAHRWQLNPAVTADPDAEAGSCVCEWDHGIVTGGLPLLLDALERAIGALRAGGAALDVDAAEVGEEEEDEEEDEEDEEDEAAYGGADWDTP